MRSRDPVELTIGVDVGGTKIAAGVVDEAGRMLDHVRISTPETVDGIDTGIAEAVAQLRRKHEVAAVGVAAAGFIDERRTGVRFAPNLPWRDHPLGDRLAEHVSLPVVVENDANAAAWAEFRFGAGADVGDMVLVTVGTGIGGGIVINDRLIRGAFGVAAEIGHVNVVRDGQTCGCGQRGCWEMYSSGRALVRAGRAMVTADPEAGAALLEQAGGVVDEIEGQMITECAQAGDPLAIAVFAEIGRWLGLGIADMAAVLDPAVVVIGGGVAEAGDLLLDPARQEFRRTLTAGKHRPHLEIRAARLGNDAGIIGAGDLARQR